MDKLLEVLGSIGFDWHVALANFVNFLIILFLLNKFLFPKIRTALAERRRVIEQGLEDAQKAETARIMAEEREKEIVRKAQLTANEIIAQANHKGNELVKKGEERGIVEGKNIIAKATLEAEKQKLQAQKDFERHAIDLLVVGVEKILVKEATDGDHNLFVERMLKQAQKTI